MTEIEYVVDWNTHQELLNDYYRLLEEKDELTTQLHDAQGKLLQYETDLSVTLNNMRVAGILLAQHTKRLEGMTCIPVKWLFHLGISIMIAPCLIALAFVVLRFFHAI